MTAIAYRLAREPDLDATYEIFRTATNDLYRQRNLPRIPEFAPPPSRSMAFRRHVLAHDAPRFWVAESADRVVGFGCATLRDGLWYLAALHVLPAWQGHGLGSTLLQRCLDAAENVRQRVVISDSLNPLSNGLYARHGLYQQHALIELSGRGLGRATGELARFDAGSVPWSAIDRLDRGALGVTRRVDHELWLTREQQALAGLRPDGRLIAYGYVSPVGIGPAAGEDDAALAAFLRAAVTDAPTSREMVIKLTGNAAGSIATLLKMGFVYRHILLLGGSAELNYADRYVVSAADALL